MFTSDIAKQYLLTEDAVEGFNLAVENGQVRLALQILTELIDGFMQVFEAITSEEEVDTDIPVKKDDEKNEIVKTPETKPEPQSKKNAKQEKPDTQEV